MTDRLVSTLLLVRLPLMLATVVFSISAYRKLKDLTSAQGHFLMGPDKLYPGWMLPLAFVHEIGILKFLYTDRPLAVVAASAFIGGIVHAQASPVGPYARVGWKILIPVVVVLACTISLAARASEKSGPISRTLGLDRLQPLGLLCLSAFVGAGGFTFATLIARANE